MTREELLQQLRVAIDRQDVNAAQQIAAEIDKLDARPTLRELGATALMAPAKTFAGLMDLGEVGLRSLGGFLGLPTPPPAGYSERVEELRTKLAGKPRGSGSRPDLAAIEGAAGGLLFGRAGALAGALAGPASEEVTHRTGSALLGAGAGLLAGASPTIVANRAVTIRSPMTRRASKLVSEAVRSAPREVLDEAQQVQEAAAKRGLFVLPSQASRVSLPKIQELEVRVLGSHAAGAEQLRQKVLRQAAAQERLAKEFVRSVDVPVVPPEVAAGQLAQAARGRLRADREFINKLTEDLYRQGHEAARQIEVQPIPAVVGQLVKALRTEFGGNKEATRLARSLLDSYTKARNAKELFEAHQSFLQQLQGAPVKGGVAKALRTFSERVLRDSAEALVPAYREAREVQAALLKGIERLPGDPLLQMAATPRDPAAYLAKVPQRAGALKQIYEGTTDLRFAADNLPQAPNLPSLAPMGAAPDVARSGLAASLESLQQRAFAPGPRGLVSPTAGATFAHRVAPTPAAEAAFEEVYKTVALRPVDVKETLEVLRALSRPFKMPLGGGAGTEIHPITLLRAGSPQQWQRTHAITAIAKALMNRMTDKEIIEILSNPRSIELMRKAPALRKFGSRELAATVAALQLAGPEEGE